MTYRILFLSSALAAALVSSGALAQTSPAITINFENLRADAANLPMYISFGGDGELVGTNLSTKSALTKGTSYSLDELSAGVSISKFPKGRIYISLGNRLLTSNAATTFQPNFNDPNRADFNTRWDKVEVDFDELATGRSGGTALLSAKDFWGIPLQLKSSGGGVPSANLSWRSDATDLFQTLGKLSSYSVKSTQTYGALVSGYGGVPMSASTGSINVVRVIGPAYAPYPDLSDYRRYLMTGNRTKPGQPVETRLVGSNGTVSGSGALQTYDMTAYFANANAVVGGGAQVSPGDLVITGTVNSGAGAKPTTLIVRSTEFTGLAMFGGLPSVEMPEGLATNNVAARLLIDFMAAMNFGFVGSTADNPAMPGTALGDSPSWTWFGNHPNGTTFVPLLPSSAYPYAQPSDAKRYNQYAASIAAVADVQSYLHSARLQAPHARLGEGSALIISVLPDTSTVRSVPPPTLSIVHGASFDPTALVAAGSAVQLGGSLPVSYETAPAGGVVPLPTKLADLSIQLSSGTFAPIFSVTPDSALVQIPWELEGSSGDTLTVRGRGIKDTPVSVNLAKYAPGIYMVNSQASKQGMIYDPSWRLLDLSNPATPGTEVVIYCTGLGPVTEPPPAGTPAESEGLFHSTQAPVRVTIGDRSVIVKYAGLAPGMIGVYQTNVLLPISVQAGDAVPVALTVGGVTSNTVTMAIRNIQ